MSPTQSTFAPADRQQWLTLIDKLLKGAPADSLTRHDEDGLAINALYDPVPVTGDSGAAVSVTRLPCDPARHIAHGWDICQPIDVANDRAGDPARVNRLIMDELADGVGSLWFHGLGDDTAMAPMLDGVMLSAVGLCLDSGASAITHLAALETVARQHGHRLGDITVDANIDPFGPAGDPQLLAAGLSLLGTADRADLPRGLFAAGGWHWHNRGMTAVEELAYILACLTDILRHGHNAGLDLALLASRLSAQLALPADLFAGIAKIRALRHCWAAVAAPLGLTVALPIHALVSRRMFSSLDIEVNMLRTTTALLGGAIGGSDRMSAFAHDHLGGSSADGRRLARMQQLLLRDESGLAHSLDPSGGAAFIEARTADLATAAWTAFQQIEAEGGAMSWHQQDRFMATARAAAACRFQRFESGELALVGVNLQPDQRQFPPAQSRWQHLSRPSAAVELIRQGAVDTPPRLLLLQGADADAAHIDRMTKILAVGHMVPVVMPIADVDAAAITAARPDHVILAGCSLDQLAAAVRTALDPLLANGKLSDADAVTKAPLALLAGLTGVDLDPFRKGDA